MKKKVVKKEKITAKVVSHKRVQTAEGKRRQAVRSVKIEKSKAA